MKIQTRRRHPESGQTLIMITLLMVPMCGIIGLVSDIGYMHFVKTSAQTAAEAAVRAAVIDFHATNAGTACGGSVVCAATATACPAAITTPANSLEHGCMYAIQHGFSSTGNQSVTYQAGSGTRPPTAPGSPVATYWVTFRVAQRVPQMFSAVLGNPSGVVVARASASLIGAADCIYALNPSASQAFSVKGTANVTSNCGILVNSSASDALYTNGSTTLSAPEYDVVGGINVHTPLTPSASTGISPISDPMAGLAAPATAPYTCDYFNYNSGGTKTLTPGVYCGGINAGSNTTYNLTAGTYIIVGGGLTTQSTNSTINGSGVTIYNTFGATTNHGNLAYSPISIAAGSTATLSAPSSGAYAGILFFEDRAAPASFDTFGGNSSSYYQGTIYAKKAAITMYGTSSVLAKYTILVADTISMVGTATFGNDYSLLATGSPVTQVAVVE